MRLSHSDLHRLQAIVLELHDVHDAETLSQAVPHLFSKIIPADGGVLMDAQVETPRKRARTLRCCESSQLMNADLIRRMERVASDHPCSRYRSQRRDRTAQAHLLRADLYNGFRHAGIGRFLATASLCPRGLNIILWSRAESHRDYTERDRWVMNLLRPHLDLARKNAERNEGRAGAGAVPLHACGLTPREREIAEWLAEGKTNLEIAMILGTSLRTVEKHVERILGKLGVENRTAAALLASSASYGR